MRDRPPLKALTAEDVFFPGLDTGLRLVGAFDATPRAIPPLDLAVLSAASSAAHRLETRRILLRFLRHRRFATGLCFPTLLVAVDDLGLDRSLVTIGGRYLFSGAAGLRLLARLGRGPGADEDQRLARLADALAERRADNPLRLPPASDADLRRDLVIPTRNLFNFYHFTRETLPQLALVARHGLTGDIVIPSPSREVAGFVRDQVDSLFPELAPRLRFAFGPFRAEGALMPLDTTWLYYLGEHAGSAAIDGMARRGWLWPPRRLVERGVRTLLQNATEDTLPELRARMLARLAPPPARRRRIYVRRRPGRRDRAVVGEADLIAMLDGLGFETLCFEDHDVTAQAQIVSEAEVLVAPHGAGLTNMLFAREGCLVVELSTLQTAQARFGDFNALAMTAGVRHLHVFVDHDWPDPDHVPRISTDGHVGQRLAPGQIALLRSVLTAHLAPDAHAALLAELSALNAAQDFDRLGPALAAARPRLLHEPDAEVWAANCATVRQDGAAALCHLQAALRLAPGRDQLADRALRLAARRGDAAAFAEVAGLHFLHAPAKAAALFAAKGWDAVPFGGAEDDGG
ncbi:glycosyltransferase family 61 protein [Frigidibacter sp. MR17.24]|uniref:glycosyltransferase family 61 protein n=1 Tax=Frigidibacter sp. MR17.24 TaxID=3127345 RepID=UPI0030131DB6